MCVENEKKNILQDYMEISESLENREKKCFSVTGKSTITCHFSFERTHLMIKAHLRHDLP